jgi:hypothetical protein
MPIAPLKPAYAPLDKTVPFLCAEEAWFWTMAALVARRDGARIAAGKGLAPRPCEPDDVVKCLDRLYRQRRIELAHARVLRTYGERGVPPSQRHPAERREAGLWVEALERLEWPLRVKGIVVRPHAEGLVLPNAGAAPPAAEIIPFPRRAAAP